MTTMKKMFFSGLFGLSLALFAIPTKADAQCNNYDVTYPSKYCDPMGSGSCTRICEKPVE